MTGENRRKAIVKELEEREGLPQSASALAERLGVSRQSVVSDVALLRAGGAEIAATPRGYVLRRDRLANGIIKTLVCAHAAKETKRELYAIVDCGCTVLDVSVEHPLYGEISGALGISSRYDADQFLEKLREEKAPPLSALTGGVHLHRVLCPDEEAFARLCESLSKLRFILCED